VIIINRRLIDPTNVLYIVNNKSRRTRLLDQLYVYNFQSPLGFFIRTSSFVLGRVVMFPVHTALDAHGDANESLGGTALIFAGRQCRVRVCDGAYVTNGWRGRVKIDKRRGRHRVTCTHRDVAASRGSRNKTELSRAALHPTRVLPAFERRPCIITSDGRQSAMVTINEIANRTVENS